MKLKKLFAGVVAVAMMATMAMPSFAATSFTDNAMTASDSLTLTKIYEVTNDKTTTPEETFTFKITPQGSAPALAAGTDTKTVHLDAFTATKNKDTTSGTFEIALSNLNITRAGIYYYTLTEVDSNNGGVTTSRPLTMKVTAGYAHDGDTTLSYWVALREVGASDTNTDGSLNKENKVSADEAFKNVYSAGELTLTKTVKGAMGDKEQYFTFEVTLTGETGKNYAGTYEVEYTARENTEGYATNPTTIKIGEKTTFHLKHGDKIDIKNLPYNVAYTVNEVEANQDDYKTTSEQSGEKVSANAQIVAYTNTKGDESILDTGVILDNAPYMLMLAVVAGGAMTLVIKKRREEE